MRYDYIKSGARLFVMLRQSAEGRNISSAAAADELRYCRGVIVEGVETLEEWRDVQRSPAFAAGAIFFLRPVPLISLEKR